MNRPLSRNRKATVDTITLIQREYYLLKKRGEEDKIIGYLSRLESKAKVRVVLLQEGKSRISSPIPEASSPDYWRGVLILIKHARVTFLEDKASFPLFLSKFKAHISESEQITTNESIYEKTQQEAIKLEQRLSQEVKDVEGIVVVEEEEPVKPIPVVTSARKSGKISILGLDRAGKTSLIQRMKTGEFKSNPAQTIGVHTEAIQINGSKFTVWDLGGEMLFRRALWDMYTRNSAGLIFVIDIVDQHRFSEAHVSLKRVMQMSHLKNVPLALFFNKRDLTDNIPNHNLLNLLEFDKINDRDSEVFQTSAKTGEGIKEGMNWLSSAIR